MGGAPRRELAPSSDNPPPSDLTRDLTAEHDSASLLRRIVRDSPSAIAAVGLDQTFLLSNPVFCAQTGADPVALAGVGGDGLLAPDFLAAVRAAITIVQDDDRESAAFEWPHPREDGPCLVHYTVSLVRNRSGAPLFYLVIGNDVTEARRREDERRRQDDEIRTAEKLESLSRMASGIAHDFNNLLLAMVGQAELALMDVPPDHAARESLREIVKVGFRAADLCKQLLAYCGKGDRQIAQLDISTLVRDLAPLLETRLGGAKLVLNLAPDLPPVAADATQLRQLVLDLVMNAAEAMRGRDAAVALSTSGHERDLGALRDVVSGQELPAGFYVRLEVRDTGCGLPEDQLARIFDPFFTTKVPGHGLGLAAVVGVVRGHRGALSASSVVGEGTTVHVDLPVAAAAPGASAGAPAVDNLDAVRKTSHILVVDDEEPVRKVSTRILEAAGHHVTGSPDGYLALELFGNEPASFDLVLLDMTMPGIGGLEALERIRQFRPTLPVLLTSGFNESEVRDVLARDGACGFIQKPYTALALQKQVAAMLR